MRVAFPSQREIKFSQKKSQEEGIQAKGQVTSCPLIMLREKGSVYTPPTTLSSPQKANGMAQIEQVCNRVYSVNISKSLRHLVPQSRFQSLSWGVRQTAGGRSISRCHQRHPSKTKAPKRSRQTKGCQEERLCLPSSGSGPAGRIYAGLNEGLFLLSCKRRKFGSKLSLVIKKRRQLHFCTTEYNYKS